MFPVLVNNVMGEYARFGDVGVIILCIVVFILLGTSYVVRTKSYRIFSSIVGLVMLAAVFNIGLNAFLSRPELLKDNPYTIGLVYLLRVIYHIILFDLFFTFSLYAIVVSNMEKKRARVISIISMSIFLIFVTVDVILTVTGVGFVVDVASGEASQRDNVFIIGYTVYLLFLVLLLYRIRKLVYKRVLWGFFLTMALAAIVRYAQLFLGNTSLTTMSFFLPVLPMLYIMHNNPYNVSLGTLDAQSMEDMIKNLYAKKKQFIIMSLLLPDYVGEDKTLPEAVRNQTRRFTVEYFRSGTLFQIGNGQIIMIARKDKNPDYNDWMRTILKAFQAQYQIHRMPYKIVYGESFENDIPHNKYISLIEHIHRHIVDNTMHRIGESDIKTFKETEYITSELEDIYRKADLNDSRVLVYCQPVFDIKTQKFETAEALMRLDLKESGIVSPAIFIPIAEKRGFIHVLTKIILNKTCKAIRELLDKGIEFNRISVNVSSIEVKDDGFCSDINRILFENNVPGDKLAIEMTESQSEEDFMIMKKKIDVLHEEGIQFYLDDFGTGYSNMERILELPFDIIKFDRSMVIAAGQDQRSGRIVENIAKMFSDFNYRVLYEGVENNDDEDRCLAMSATYLQGFKYSKPIPIERLTEFFDQTKSPKA